jgi:2-polyprenyl-3-methyl-5-hydroxy-6-metoxy-1,4-benzoquinol methylase
MHIHDFIPSELYKDYEQCLECGSYHSTAQVDPKIIYEDEPYWGDGTGRSTLEQQCSNLTCIDECGISKVDRLMQSVPKNGNVALEIGCAPGILLKRLMMAGYKEVIGIEPSERYIEFIGRQAPGAIIAKGFYPEIINKDAREVYDLVVGMDVLEHCDDYEDFFETTHRVLTQDGVAIFMSPIILEDGLLRKRDMDYPDQHCWIFTEKFLKEYLEPMFSKVEFRRWVVGHELLILTK